MRKAANWLKKRWNVESDWRLAKIFLLFAVTGSSTVWVRKPLFSLLNISSETFGWFYYPIRIISIFFIYQLMFLVMGIIFREVPFTRKFVSKMLSRFGIKVFQKEVNSSSDE